MPNKNARIEVTENIQLFNQLIDTGILAYSSGDLDTFQKSVDTTGKLLAKFCTSGYPEITLMLELPWYQAFVKKIESDGHYATCFQHHTKKLFNAGVQNSPGPIRSGDPNCIAFIAQNSVLLGHTEVMLLVMKNWRVKYPHIKMLFIGLTPCQKDLAERLDGIGVESITPDGKFSPLNLVKWLRQTTTTRNVGTAIWLSLPLWVPYIFGYGIAKRQIYWSLKFHAVHLGREVIHIGMTKDRNGTVNIHGKPWLAFQPPLCVSINERDIENRASLRGIYNNKFIFASLAREEKFNSPRFANAVAQILKRCPGSIYMFTGREISRVMAEALENQGVAAQAMFIGWVDTELYANLIDCFLETFPFGCGVTGMQALSHGTPIISLWDSDTLPTFYFNDSIEASNFNSNWNVTNNEADYISAALDRFQSWTKGDKRISIPAEVINSLDAEKYSQFFKLVTEN